MNNVIKFPTHRVRRDPADQLMRFYYDQFVASLNILRALYGLPPLDGRP